METKIRSHPPGRTLRWAIALAFALLVAACGGGGESPAPESSTPTVTTIIVTLSATSVGVGQSRSATAEARDQNGAVMTGVSFSWASSNGSVATVAAGVVTGVAPGTTGITASSGGVTSAAASINVNVVAVGSVVIDKPMVFLPGGGQSAQLAAQVLDPRGAPAFGTVTWTSSAPDKVSVDAAGRLVALAIGSAQIFAEASGARSAPTLVLVAQPKAGALLVTDSQVVSVSSPLGGVAGELPGVGTQYEVTLQGVAAPAPGAMVIAAETAPVAGKVVATRQEATGLVVTLALAPLYELFSDYNIALSIDLSTVPLEAVSTRAAGAPRSTRWRESPRALQVARPLEVLEPFKAFDCKASIEPQLIEKAIQLTPQARLTLVLEDRPGYSKHALEGSLQLVGSVGLKLQAGFKASGTCEAKRQYVLKAGGWLGVIVSPAIHYGLGAELSGEVLVVQAELGAEGTVGMDVVAGWECGGVSPACRSLDEVKPLNNFKTKSKFPSVNDLQAKVSARFYAFAGLDAAIGLGAVNGSILEARSGPRQSFDLAFEEDQAARPDYAASYDLKLESGIEPGAALKKAIEKVIGDDSVGVKFKGELSTDVSESPKGVLSVSVAKVRPGSPVDFTVDLDQKTVAYWLLDYNVVGVELYRRKEGETKFTFWKFMDLIATNRATYRWTPTTDDAGKYEIAALTKTKIEVPLLEVAKDSVRELEVSCFGGPAPMASPSTRAQAQAARDKPLALSCTDTWAGTASVIGRTPGSPPTDNITTTSTVSWRYDRNEGGTLLYIPSGGSFDLKFNFTSTGCATALLPNHFIIPNDPLSQSKLFISKIPLAPPTYGIAGSQFVNFTATTSCPGKADVVTQFVNYRVDYASGSGPFNDQAVLSGTYEDAQFTNTWNFSRP